MRCNSYINFFFLTQFFFNFISPIPRTDRNINSIGYHCFLTLFTSRRTAGSLKSNNTLKKQKQKTLCQILIVHTRRACAYIYTNCLNNPKAQKVLFGKTRNTVITFCLIRYNYYQLSNILYINAYTHTILCYDLKCYS